MIAASEDYTPVAAKVAYAAKLPQGELLVIHDSRHATPTDQPAEFNKGVISFIARHRDIADGDTGTNLQLTMQAVADTVAADTGLSREQAELLSVALTGAAQITATWWLDADRPIPKAEAVRLHWPPAGLSDPPHLVLDDVVDPANAHHHDPARLAGAVLRVGEAEAPRRRRTVSRTA